MFVKRTNLSLISYTCICTQYDQDEKYAHQTLLEHTALTLMTYSPSLAQILGCVL